ncbi:ABC transporter substrate-binding protein [uncultured Methanospirillum sp.]|uniref:ABC transporter substrate-binding protein n=1 Tax=uncultured Methanospirillum sp. TaxID=262503 RepID=UPI0029C63498|nr:ABC transporter substrate-binding protein [uncultured Methanospirillum sp.]
MKSGEFHQNIKRVCSLSLLLILFGFICSSGCISNLNSNSTQTLDKSSQSIHQITIIDDLNRTVVLPDYPKRIVSVNHNVLNLLIAYGAGDKIVGVPEYVLGDQIIMSHLPNAVGVGGSLANVNCEQMIALKPDVILAFAGYKPRASDRIDMANIPIIYLNAYYITDIQKDSHIIGQLAGNESKSDEYNDLVTNYLALIDNRTSNQSTTPLRVYLEWSSDNIAQGKNSQGDRIMKALHATNIAGDINLDYPTINNEWVVKQNPDVIIKFVTSTGLRENTTSFLNEYHKIGDRTGYSTISAVQNHRVYLVNQDLMSNSRGIAGILYLAKALYPSKFIDIDPHLVLKEYADKFQPDADKIQQFFSPSQESGGNLSLYK